MGQTCFSKADTVPKKFTLDQALQTIQSNSQIYKALADFDFNIFQAT